MSSLELLSAFAGFAHSGYAFYFNFKIDIWSDLLHHTYIISTENVVRNLFVKSQYQTDKQTNRHFIRRIRIHSHTKWFTIQCTWFFYKDISILARCMLELSHPCCIAFFVYTCTIKRSRVYWVLRIALCLQVCVIQYRAQR